MKSQKTKHYVVQIRDIYLSCYKTKNNELFFSSYDCALTKVNIDDLVYMKITEATKIVVAFGEGWVEYLKFKTEKERILFIDQLNNIIK